MQVNLEEAEILVMDVLMAGKVPNITSSPGIGKSDLIRKIAKDTNLKVIDFRLAQMDPTDLNGFPTLNKERMRSHYAPPENIPLESDPVPEGYDGWLLFFDEMNAAPMSVQAAGYKIILDRMIGDRKLHAKVAMVCAGNKATDKAIVNRLSTAMQSRLIHIDVMADVETWINNWAIPNQADYRIIGFIRFRDELLHKFDPNHNDVTFPCPRTWAFLSDIIKDWTDIPDSKLPLIAGTIGEGPALEFKGFLDIFSVLPTKEQLLKSPEIANVPDEPSALFALTAFISTLINKQTLEKLMVYVNRLPVEFQVIALQNVLRHTRELLQEKSVKAWIALNAAELL